MRPRVVLATGAAVRVVLIAYSIFHDAHCSTRHGSITPAVTPKYTDVDYVVFSDAAALVADGSSPFMRPTFRLTPAMSPPPLTLVDYQSVAPSPKRLVPYFRQSPPPPFLKN
jgi:hypothetical protein